MESQAKLLAPLSRPRTIAQEVAERLILAIANGEQKTGERLTEGSIAEVMQVSRVPAREALQYLESIGIVIPLEPRGLRIVDFSRREAIEVREVRLALESVAIKAAMPLVRADKALLAPLDRALDTMRKTFESGDVISLAQCDLGFHREVMRLSGNQLLLKFWEGLAPHLLILFCRDWNHNRRKVAEVNLHQQLRMLIADGLPTDVEPMLMQHFTTAESG